ncbi:hypothetical protein FGO68_gene7058 [Halteria grandinella]|uniref:B30.2/SPRY domain-containing protein n=1 Tax=Halteria grandinella TaxID=5974 RepID=A0A8J8NK78_HALGN|nr:hypothetical protein FGO68_gene7058 [Halteria grandinella]
MQLINNPILFTTDQQYSSQDSSQSSTDSLSPLCDLPFFWPHGFEWVSFSWNPKRTSAKLVLLTDNCSDHTQHACISGQDGSGQPSMVKVKDGAGFKSAFGTQAMVRGGRYFFQVKLVHGTLMKVGIARKGVSTEHAFSDGANGWAIYNGELRHNSNSTGDKYGKSFYTGDIVGVYLDMIEGTLAFSRNGVYWGVAFTSEEFKKGVFYPAVAPIYQNDTVITMNPPRED